MGSRRIRRRISGCARPVCAAAAARREKMTTLKEASGLFARATRDISWHFYRYYVERRPGAHRAINHFATTYTAPGESPMSKPPRRGGGDGGGGDLCADSEDGLNA